MKKNVLTLLAGAALLCACQPTQKGTTISGTLTGVESDTLDGGGERHTAGQHSCHASR